MKFIKRFIFVIILLLIAFFVYRLINPVAAKGLLRDLKSFSNTTIGTHFSLDTPQALVTTGVVLDMTGTIIQDTGALVEITDEELLLSDLDLYSGDVDGIPTVTGTSTFVPTVTGTDKKTSTGPTIDTPPTVSSSPAKPKTPTNGLSSKEKRDLDNFLDNFGN